MTANATTKNANITTAACRRASPRRPSGASQKSWVLGHPAFALFSTGSFLQRPAAVTARLRDTARAARSSWCGGVMPRDPVVLRCRDRLGTCPPRAALGRAPAAAAKQANPQAATLLLVFIACRSFSSVSDPMRCI
jgi:hypothetical protein